MVSTTLKGAMTVKWPASIGHLKQVEESPSATFAWSGETDKGERGWSRKEKITQRKNDFVFCWSESGWRYHAE
jgi:hypothetical protein